MKADITGADVRATGDKATGMVTINIGLYAELTITGTTAFEIAEKIQAAAIAATNKRRLI